MDLVGQLNKIQDAKCVLTLHCYEGKVFHTQKGDLKGYVTVWYHTKGVANILSLHHVKKKHKVTYDSSMIIRFLVHKADCTNCKFKPSKKGLLFSDVKRDVIHILGNTVYINPYSPETINQCISGNRLQNAPHIRQWIIQTYKKHIEHLVIKISSWDKHVPEIERYHQGVQATVNILPFEQYLCSW